MRSDGASNIGFLQCFGWLLIVTALLAAFQSLYVVTGTSPSPRAQLIGTHTLPICLAAWVQVDARRRRLTPCLDFGMFVLGTWGIAIPYYLLWTRKWRGLLVLLLFFVLLTIPAFAARLVWSAEKTFYDAGIKNSYPTLVEVSPGDFRYIWDSGTADAPRTHIQFGKLKLEP